MANIRSPQFGVKKDELTLTTQDPASVLYGVTSDNKWIPIKITDDGSLVLGSSITLEAGDLEIGAVEIKNYNTDDRAYVSANHEVLAQARLYDAVGNPIGSTGNALNVVITGGGSDHFLSNTTDNVLVYGFDGSVNRALLTDVTGQLQVGVVSSVLPTGAATEVTLATRASESTLSGFRTDFNAVDFSTETTLLAVKTDLEQFTFTTGSVNSNITNSTLAVTQSGIWSIGRTWVLSSGADSVAAVQSGTWNINDISGVVSLPTGASTEATLSGFKTDFNAVDFSTETTLAAVKTDLDQFQFDGLGNLKVSVVLETAEAVQIKDSTNTVINPAKEDGNLLSIKTNTDNLDVLLSTRASESTLLAIKTDTDQFTFTTGSVNSNITNSTLAVTQSGIWTVGRTWSLASGTDSISAVQSGTWNINNISGIISLPTGAATEATLGTLLLNSTFTSRINTLGQKTMANSTPIVIASDQTAIPVSQSGTWNINNISGTISLPTGASTLAEQQTQTTSLQLIDDLPQTQGSTTSGQKGVLVQGAVTTAAPTYTTAQTSPLSLDLSGNLRVVSHADTSGGSAPSSSSISDYVSANKVFVTAFNINQPLAGSDNPLLYIRNPTGSGKTLYIYKIGLGINVANVFSNFKLYVDPTVTVNGTSQAATSLNTGGGSPAATMLVTSTPTVTVNGTIIESWQAGQNTNSISFIEDFSIHIAANHSMLITGNPSSNNRGAAITLVWVEV